MSIGKKCAPSGESINVGCSGLRMSPQTTDPVIQVVDGNQENVGSIIGLQSRVEFEQQTSNGQHQELGHAASLGHFAAAGNGLNRWVRPGLLGIVN